jgi:hypothetical protein
MSKTFSNRTAKVQGKEFVKWMVENCGGAAEFECSNLHMVCPKHVDHDPACKKYGRRCSICNSCIIRDGVNSAFGLNPSTGE